MTAGLYIHIPFCKSKCSYCGFYSIASDNDTINKYIDIVIREMEKIQSKDIDTVYIGGGTPSILGEYQLEKLLNAVKLSVSKKKNNAHVIEYTVEANPDSLTKEKLHIFKDAGVNRISLGIQSLDDDVLSLLGRIHDARVAINALEMVLDCNFFQISCDVIYDIPTADFRTIYSTLEILTSYPIHHVSAYNYSFDTEFLKEYKSIYDETAYNDIVYFLENKGFKQYEISNFAKYGFHSKHNTKYWKMEEYIGVGITAHSMVYDNDLRVRTANIGTVKEYLDNTHNLEVVNIPFKEQMLEDIVFGLRIIEGVNLSELTKRYNYSMDKLFESIYHLIQEELIVIKEGYLCLTKKGQLFLDYVQEYFWEHFSF